MLDEIGAGSERDADMNRILNTLDGVQTKGSELTVIFTTNHEKRINEALRRPGRIDLVVNFSHPDKDSVAKIYKLYFEGLPNEDKLNYKALAEFSPEVSGAVIAEIAKRAAKLAKKHNTIDENMVKVASDSMRHQIELMSDKIEQTHSGEMVIALKGANISLKHLNGEAALLEKN